MNKYADIIKNYLFENEIIYESGIQSLVELLFWHYTQCNPPKDPQIRRSLDKMYETLEGLEFSCADGVRAEVLYLCFLHEQAGFREGFRVGLGLMAELTDSK